MFKTCRGCPTELECNCGKAMIDYLMRPYCGIHDPTTAKVVEGELCSPCFLGVLADVSGLAA